MKDWVARLYRENTGFVSDLGEPVVALLAPRPGERVLDIGCGDGALTQRLIDAGCEVVGIDASTEMVDAARERGLDARVMDARDLAGCTAFSGDFDAVFSNAALHWVQPLEPVVEGIRRVLKPGGRFVAELGGEGNIDSIRRALHDALRDRGIDPRSVDPWDFPSPQGFGALLQGRRFEITFMEHFDRPTELPDSITGWVESTARPFLAAVPPDHRADFLADVEASLAPALRGNDGRWRADYVRLRVAAVRERSAC